AAQVGGDRQVAPLVELVVAQARPAAVQLAAAHAAAQHEGDAGVAVIGSVSAVLADRAAELGGGDQRYVGGARTEIVHEGREGFRQLAQIVCQLAGLRGV